MGKRQRKHPESGKWVDAKVVERLLEEPKSLSNRKKSEIWGLVKEKGLDESEGLEWADTKEDMIEALSEYEDLFSDTDEEL